MLILHCSGSQPDHQEFLGFSTHVILFLKLS